MKTILQRLTVVWPLVTILLFPALTRAETAVQAWVQRYNGPGNGFDTASAVAVDGSNNVIVTGYSPGSGSSSDYATIEYSSTGAPLWTNRYNGTANGYDVANAVAVDGSNNVIVTGYSSGSGSSYDYATIKYSVTGVPLWTNRYNGLVNGADYANALAIDGSNNVIVTGSSEDGYATIKYSSAGIPVWTNRYFYNGETARAVAVDGSNNVIVTGSSFNGTYNDYLTIKYSGAGVPLWTNRYTGLGDDYANALSVDGSNNVIVTGYSAGSGSSDDYATVNYSSAGVPLWTNRYNGPGNGYDYARAVKVDGNNNVIVTGNSTGSGSDFDYATIKYSNAGVPLWTNRYNGPGNGGDVAYAVAVDSRNNVIVTGASTVSGGDWDYTTIKYSSAGVPVWTNRYNGPVNDLDQANAIVVDGSNNVIVTGWSYGSSATYDYATVKYVVQSDTITRTVTSTNDSGAGSLRQAIADAASGDTINLAVTGTIRLTNGQLSVCGKNLTITGPGATNLTISGNNASRVFYVCTNTSLTLSDLTIANGYSTNGGGVYNDGGLLNLSTCVLTGNRAQCHYSADGTAAGGAVYNLGTLSATNCLFATNTASGYFDMGYGGAAAGGGIYNATNAVCELASSTLCENQAQGGNTSGDSGARGGVAQGGGIYNTGTLRLRNVTSAANVARGGDTGPLDGLYEMNYGGDAFSGGVCSSGTTAMTNCTFASDRAVAGMGEYTYEGQRYPNPASSYGEAIHVSENITVLKNSVLGPNCCSDISGAITDAGHNFSRGYGALTNTTSRTGTNVLLGPLGYYGGPTPTVPLLYGSPAINAADTAAAPATDQRGFARPFGAAADIGAYEWGAAPPTPPRFTSFRRQTGSMELQVSGEIGRVFEIRGSSNLTAWFLLTTLTNNTGSMLYTNTGISGEPLRFYRAIQLP